MIDRRSVIIIAEYKVQHFVPQWYQRNFSSDLTSPQKEEHIFVYDIKSKTFKEATIYGTAQEDDFYGYSFEKSLQEIENDTAAAISAIIKNEKIKGLSESSRTNLLQFITLQSTRTKSAKIITEKAVHRILDTEIKPKYKKLYENSPDLLSYIDTLDLSDADFFKQNMKIAMASVIGISDLTAYLLINKSTTPFITSDHPVVTNNYFYNKQVAPGFLTPGLQIIVPLTDTLCILLIHANLYEIHSDKQFIIEVTQNSDVDFLNELQILNCYQQVLSNYNRLNYLKKIHCNSEVLKKKSGFGDISEENNYGFHFTFLKFNREAHKKIPEYALMAIMAKKSNKARTANPFRNQTLFDESWIRTEKTITEFMDEYQSKNSVTK